MTQHISIIGLGKLGSCMAAVYASKGHSVIGVDLNPDTIATLSRGQAPVSETGLHDLMALHRQRLEATHDVERAVSQSDITFVIVPTPSKEDGSFSMNHVAQAFEKIGEGIKRKQGYHLVVLTSTVLPGDCQQHLLPMMERTSSKEVGRAFGFCYSPLFIAIGSVIHNLLYPDFFLVGESDPQAGQMLESFYATVRENDAPVRRMSIPSAELTKISVNSYVTMKITFANMLAEVADAIPGANIDHITHALGTDTRIGSSYLKPGLGYGGPCFPRDNRAFAYMARRHGIEVPFAERTDLYNQSVMTYWAQKIKDIAIHTDSIGFVGISYKPGTAFAEESQAIGIARILLSEGYTLHVHNPDGHDHARELLGTSVTFHEALDSCVNASHVLFLGLPMPRVVASLQPLLKQRPIKVVDPWRQAVWH